MLRSLFGGFNDLTRGKRIVFLAINKTGSSSLWTWMDEHGVPYLMNRYREDEARKLRIIAEVKRKGIPCFTVVRNPWSRAVSNWKWNMQEKGLAPCSFEEFLRMPLAGLTEQQRFHTLPQWRHVADEHGAVDYLSHVGRLENIEATRDAGAGGRNVPSRLRAFRLPAGRDLTGCARSARIPARRRRSSRRCRLRCAQSKRIPPRMPTAPGTRPR
jgi:hypothetical protein